MNRAIGAVPVIGQAYKMGEFTKFTLNTITGAVLDPDSWDYCSPGNLTRYGKTCEDECSKRGEDYYWCHTLYGWEYCSPTSKIRKVHLDSWGKECLTRCSKGNEDYYWCYTSKILNDPRELNWFFCSPTSNSTSYSHSCINTCGHYGSKYYWCKTSQGWDYCSPDLDLHRKQTKGGGQCNGLCSDTGYW